jgi:hypothetical protein
MRRRLDIFTRIFSFRIASANADSGSGFRTTRSTASTDAQRRREKERLMCGVL